MQTDPNCIFCKIITGDIPSYKLYEDNDTYAFMDINPANEGHALVIPKVHAANVHECGANELAATIITVKKIAGAVEQALSPGGINLVQANGPSAAQSVMHFHMHILPRYPDDGLMLNWGLKPGDMESIGAIAERIRKFL